MISIYINLSVENIIKEYKMSEMHNKNAENTISIRFFYMIDIGYITKRQTILFL